MIVQPVPPQFAQRVWPQVGPMLSAALAHSAGEYTVEQLKALVVYGQQTLLVALDDKNTIHGAATIALTAYPNMNIATITALGGRGIINMDTHTQLLDWCREQGATHLRASCRPSAARLFSRCGMQQRYITMDKPL